MLPKLGLFGILLRKLAPPKRGAFDLHTEFKGIPLMRNDGTQIRVGIPKRKKEAALAE